MVARMKTALTAAVLGMVVSGVGLAQAAPPAAGKANPSTRAALDFLKFFDSAYLGIYRVAQEAQWKASTDVSEEHNGERTGANTAMAVFMGDKNVIETCKTLLQKRKELPAVVARELDTI